MTANKNLLLGKWEFIKAERHNGTEWEQTDFAKGMTWEFYPIFFNDNKTIGNISESTPTSNKYVSLNYSFNSADNSLRIEVYTDPETKIKDETDIFEIVKVIQTSTQTTIILNLINQIDSPPPYLRYTLHQVKTLK